MKTIEERAHEYAIKRAGGHYEGGTKGMIYEGAKNEYIKIATEQRNLDIEEFKINDESQNKQEKVIIELMSKPQPRKNYWDKELSDCHLKIMDGKEVLYRFYDQGLPNENHIPQELQIKNWRPEENNLYNVWWYHTNPADPCDTGIDKLFYIEEIKEK